MPSIYKKQFRSINEYSIEENTGPLHLLEETKLDSDTPRDLLITAWFDELPTLEVLAVNVDGRPIEEGLPDATQLFSSLSFPVTDDLSIYNQPTWLLPTIQRPTKVNTQTSLSEKQASASESYLGLIRNLVKNSGIYAISSLASPLVMLLLTPFLTHTLSRTDYGALAVLNTVVALVTGMSALGLGPAFTRIYSYDCKTQREQMDALSTLVLVLLLIQIPITAIGVMEATWLSMLTLGNTSYSGSIEVAFVLVLSQNLTIPGLVWLRVESRAVFFSIISIANLLMTAGASIVLVGILHMGITGFLVANGLGDVIIIVCTLPIIFWHAGFHLRLDVARNMLAFGTPDVMNLISGWFLQLSDRYLLEHFVSLSLAAGYSVAYMLGGVLSTAIIAPFSLAWWVLMYTIAKRKDAQHMFKLIFRGFSFVLLFATLGMSLFGSSFFDLLFPESYHAQSSIIPIIALSMLFNGIFTVVNLGTSLQRKTWLTSLYFIVSALINIGLNIILIPVYGAMGAAIATLVAYIVLALISYLFNQRIYPVPFEIGLFLLGLGIGIGLYIIDNRLLQGQSIIVSWSVHTGILLFYGVCLLFLGGFVQVAKRRHFSRR